jgi:hypothetical protein
MLRNTLITACMITTVLIGAAIPAQAARSDGYSIEILVDGRPLQEMLARGTTYVEAVEGREYAVRLTNHTGRRVAIALAVDGLNSIDAKTTAARRASKWVLGPYETVTVDGWQTGPETARRFYFTTEDRSYGAWLGRTDNLGVIEAVVFREARPQASVWPWKKHSRPRGRDGASAAPPAPSQERSAQSRSQDRSEKCAPEGELSDDLAATGIGREVDNPVRRVEFVAEARPAAHLRVRYEYRAQLVRLGVLPQPVEITALERRERAHGFSDFDFAPDPYGSR